MPSTSRCAKNQIWKSDLTTTTSVTNATYPAGCRVYGRGGLKTGRFRAS
jgi:hypothetical protein